MKKLLRLCCCVMLFCAMFCIEANAVVEFSGTYKMTAYTSPTQVPNKTAGYSAKCEDCWRKFSSTQPANSAFDTLYTITSPAGRVHPTTEILSYGTVSLKTITSTGPWYVWGKKSTGGHNVINGKGYEVNELCQSKYRCAVTSSEAKTVQSYRVDVAGTYTDGDVVFKSCNFQTSISSQYAATVNSGSFQGSPALNAPKFNVKKGTFTDISGTSTFLVDEESTAERATVSGYAVTTVKLTNPPIIIDWSDFDLDIDLAAPIIEVLRVPADTHTPVTAAEGVKLSIRAYDAKATVGELEPRISINGGPYYTGQVEYTATENQIVSVVAIDGNGNTREYQVNIGNIDSEAPTAKEMTLGTDSWTKDPVRVTVTATDDVKLHSTAYRFTFLSTADEKAGKTFDNPTFKGDWQADKAYRVPDSGTVWVEVRDSLGQITTSDPFYVNNIDLIAPTATVQLSPATGKVSPKTGVTVTINPVNTGDPKNGDASPLASSLVRWSENEAWSSELSKTIYENGVYNIQVRDSVGNVSAPIPVTISNIITSKPVITSFGGDHTRADFVMAPVTLKVEATGGVSNGETIGLDVRPYSWDGGNSWTSLNTQTVSRNGEYTVIVRDELGITTTESIVVANIDSVVPSVGVYLYKGAPNDWDDVDPPTLDDYVWKVRVEATDLGSGVDHIETLWNGGTSTQSTLVQEIEEPGVYGVIVYDRAGNHTYAEKTVSAEAIGQSAGTANNEVIPITAPSAGGTAGVAYGGADISDLVYSKTGAYNKSTGAFTDYATAGYEGIVVNLTATSKSNRFMTGYATFNSSRYPVEINGSASGSQGGKNMLVVAKIPKSAMTTDVKNGRLIVVLQEYDGDPGVNNVNGATLTKEGSVTLFTSVQANDPHISYTYNRATDELTLVATSAVAGIKSKTYSLGGSTAEYTAPFTVGGATSIVLTAVDNCGNITSLTLDGTQLAVSGEGGGSLPTEPIADSGELPVYYTAGRNSETYIIGGTRTNTENIPAQGVLESILDGTT